MMKGSAVNARLRVENLYKIFSPAPAKAMALLTAGASKEDVLAQAGAVIGLNNVSLDIPAGEITVIMGLSGSGKSTLARCLNRLNEPTSGRILLDGTDIVPLGPDALREVRRTRISMVFQHFALLPHKNVLENVEFGLKLRGTPKAVRQKRAEEVLATVGLARWANHRPDQLSGGMRQRVGLARALATDADVLIMDEAFSALDPLIRSEMQDELIRLQRVLDKTILFITHDFQEALKLGNKVVIMADGEVVRQGTPQSIVVDPGNDFVAAFTRDVDRSRLFDAKFAMGAIAKIAPFVFGEPDGCGFVVNDDLQVTGMIRPADIEHIRSGADASQIMTQDFLTIRCSEKLLDVARCYRPGQPVAVVDEEGRLVGALCAEKILAGIAAASSPVTEGHADA